MISVCYRMKLLDFPDEAKAIKLREARKRGRPTINKGALTRIYKETFRIEEEDILSYSESEQEEKEVPLPKKRGRPAKEKVNQEEEDDFDLFESSASATATKSTEPSRKKAKTTETATTSKSFKFPIGTPIRNGKKLRRSARLSK